MKYPLISLYITLLFLVSCKRDKPVQYSHPEYFNKIFTKAHSINAIDAGSHFTYLDSAFNAFPHPGIKDLYRKYAFKSSCFIGWQNGISELYIDSMLWVIRDHLQDPEFAREYARALLLKADMLIYKKDFIGAFDCNFKARGIIEKIKDTCLQSTYTFMLGSISYKQRKDTEAVRYNKLAIAEMAACPDDDHKYQLIQVRLNNIGLSYDRCGMPDSAMAYFNRALAFLDSGKKKFGVEYENARLVQIAKGIVYGNMGDALLQKCDTAGGERSYKSDTNLQKGFDPGDGQCTRLKLVTLYLVQNRLPEAGVALQLLRSSLDSFPDTDNRLKWYRLQLEYLDKTGNTKEEYSYINPYLTLKDSLESLRQMPQIDLKQEYKHIKDQYDLALLAKENKLKSQYLAIVLSCSLLVIVAVLLLWFNWKRSNTLNDKLSKQNDELQLTLNSLTESQKENTRMMQIVAHDLKNPISSMISVTSLILENNNLTEEDREMMELMQTSSLNAIDMISDLLNLNRTEGMLKEPVDIGLLLRYCVDLLQFKASEKKQRIVLVSEKATLMINREKIWRVMSNLIVNAMKFSAEDKNISIAATRHNKDFRIMVQDRGIGIPEKIQQRVFEMFSIAQRPGTAGEKSYGMGLAISKQIIEAHGGKIWFESEEGKGTKFYIDLPM